MEARTRDLEAELQRSSEEVGELKAKLDDVRKEALTDACLYEAKNAGRNLVMAQTDVPATRAA